jgi:hypothetical protein
MSGYVIVEFNDGKRKTVLAVPESWVVSAGDENVCYFPKHNATKAIKERVTVRGDWKKYVVRKLS